MDSSDKTLEPAAENWKQRIIFPTFLAGIVGGGAGLVSKHRKVHGNLSATYAANFAIVTACYTGAREFVRVNRNSAPDDLLNSSIGGFGCGAILGRLQGQISQRFDACTGGVAGAIRYSIVFAVAGTAADFTVLRVKPYLKSLQDSLQNDKLKLPEWSPIQVLDEEALAAKRAREQQLFAQRNPQNLSKETS